MKCFWQICNNQVSSDTLIMCDEHLVELDGKVPYIPIKPNIRMHDVFLDSEIKQAKERLKIKRLEVIAPKHYEIEDKIASAEESGKAFMENQLKNGLLSEIEDIDVEVERANRDKMDNVRYDLVSPFMIESLAKTFAEGAIKYGDQNWRKGLPFSNLLNHAMNHLVKYAMGDKSEPHLDHAFWNIGAMIEFRETGREPELNDLYFHKKDNG